MIEGSKVSSQNADVAESDEHRQHLRASTENREGKWKLIECSIFRGVEV